MSVPECFQNASHDLAEIGKRIRENLKRTNMAIRSTKALIGFLQDEDPAVLSNVVQAFHDMKFSKDQLQGLLKNTLDLKKFKSKLEKYLKDDPEAIDEIDDSVWESFCASVENLIRKANDLAQELSKLSQYATDQLSQRVTDRCLKSSEPHTTAREQSAQARRELKKVRKLAQDKNLSMDVIKKLETDLAGLRSRPEATGDSALDRRRECLFMLDRAATVPIVLRRIQIVRKEIETAGLSPEERGRQIAELVASFKQKGFPVEDMTAEALPYLIREYEKEYGKRPGESSGSDTASDTGSDSSG